MLQLKYQIGLLEHQFLVFFFLSVAKFVAQLLMHSNICEWVKMIEAQASVLELLYNNNICVCMQLVSQLEFLL